MGTAPAMCVCPRKEHAKRLLPRAFELIAQGDDTSDYPNLLWFLEPWDWRSWSKSEVGAIEAFCSAFCVAAYGFNGDSALTWHGREDFHGLETCLITLASMGFDVIAPLEAAVQAGSTAELAQLVPFADLLVAGEIRCDGFWKPFPGTCREITRVVRSPKTLAALEAAVLKGEGEEKTLTWLSALHSYLEEGAPSQFSVYAYWL